MTPPRDVLLVKAREWIDVADQDLRVARHTMTMPDCPYRMAAYHAQQCVEKYLKAFLVWRCVDFPFTHNIAVLREFCMTEGASWAAQMPECDELSPYATTSRYPGDWLQVSEAEAREGIGIAERLRLAVRGAFYDEGVDL